MFNGFKRQEKRRIKGTSKSTQDQWKLMDGISIVPEDFQTEQRGKTLFLKAILVYMLVMGAMGSYLSAVDVEVFWAPLHVTVLLSSLFCVSLYYSRIWQNIGYLFLLLIMAAGGWWLGKYINSGFYSVANDLSEAASVFFDSNAMKSYGEQVGDSRLAATISMGYIGCVCCILANIFISRKMRCGLVIAIAVGILAMPLYLEQEPGFLYMAMFFSGSILCFMMRGSGHYRLSFDDNKYQWDIKKRNFFYLYDAKTLVTVMGITIAVIMGVLSVFRGLYPKELHQRIRGTSGIKEASMETVENVSMLGLAGLFNFYPSTGGLTNGTLGGVSSIRYDYETDLRVKFTPYSENRVYLKTFTGCEYLPVRNRWQRQTDNNGNMIPEKADLTTKRMKQNYERNKKNTAKGRIVVENIAADTGEYLPYYSLDIGKGIYPGAKKEYIYYPSVSEDAVGVTETDRKQAARDWMHIPEENVEAVEQLCRDAGLSEKYSVQENVQRLAQYYQEDIPYSYRPGATPYQEDFINYFLKKNRRGYCAHFASAAALAFRYMGIPARYVEGYAIDPSDISEDGTILDEEDRKKYYKGYSELGDTAVVSVNVTDASAHAWVEVYDPDLGWQVADVTPASNEEEPDGGLWQRLLRFLGGGSNDTENSSQKENGQAQGDAAGVKRTTGYVSLGILLVAACLFLGRWGLKRLCPAYRYLVSNRNDRLIMEYQKHIAAISRKKQELNKYKNYKEQLKWMNKYGYWRADVVSLKEAVSVLEKAGFSKHELTCEEYKKVRSCFCRRNHMSSK